MIIGAGLVAVIPLSFRRRAPTAVCLIMAGYAVLLTATLGSRPLVSLLVALYTAAVWSDRVRARLCLAAVLAAHAVAVAYEASFAGSGISTFAVTAVATGLRSARYRHLGGRAMGLERGRSRPGPGTGGIPRRPGGRSGGR